MLFPNFENIVAENLYQQQGASKIPATEFIFSKVAGAPPATAQKTALLESIF